MKRLIPCHNRLTHSHHLMKIKPDEVQNTLLKKIIENKLFQVPFKVTCILQTCFLSPLKKYYILILTWRQSVYKIILQLKA